MLNRVLPFVLCAIASLNASSAPDAASYLPLTGGHKWVLRAPGQPAPAVFQVIQTAGNQATMQAITPWGSSEWTLTPVSGRFEITAFGTGGNMAPLPDHPVYLDFSSPAGTQWSNSLGTLTVVSRSLTVRVGTQTYNNCIQIRHQGVAGADLRFTFAPNVGYVQFIAGPFTFSLEAGASSLPIPNPPAGTPARLLIGLTPNTFANEPLNAGTMMARFNQTLGAGVTFLVGNDDWAGLEPQPGHYALDSVNELTKLASSDNLFSSYTIRVINTIARDVPTDLQTTAWTDPRMTSRVLKLIDTVAPLIKGKVQWFTFGYEVDGYLSQHPSEIAAFTALHRLATDRMKQLVPGIQVSATITFSGLGQLQGPLAQLNQQLDFVAVTYAPLKPDFTVEDPSVAARDFARMKQIAGGRKIILQEIAFPSSATAGSDEDKQAEFYRQAFQQLAMDPQAFDAVNFMMLADLSPVATQRFANYYGINAPAFRAALQTLGMFDVYGRPKPGWAVFCSNAAH